MEEAIVRGIKRDRVAVETVNHDFVLFDMIGTLELSTGDIIMGDFSAPGTKQITLKRNGSKSSVCIEFIGCSRSHAQSLLSSY